MRKIDKQKQEKFIAAK